MNRTTIPHDITFSHNTTTPRVMHTSILHPLTSLTLTALMFAATVSTHAATRCITFVNKDSQSPDVADDLHIESKVGVTWDAPPPPRTTFPMSERGIMKFTSRTATPGD